MIFLHRLILLFFIATSTLTLVSCSSGEIKESNSAEAAFKEAEEFDKDERYEDAITKYNEVKNKHPYSKFAVEAELRIADIHFKKESWLEAQTAYQIFKDFHPKHPRSDYVTFRLAMSYFNQLPETIDRDLTPATKAINYFDEVTTSFSQSSFAAEAKTNKQKAQQMLADKEAYIANFYFIRGKYESSLRRYNSLLIRFPGFGHDEESLYRAGVSAFEIGDASQGRERLNQLKSRFPNSSFVSKADSILEKYGNR